MLVKYKKLHPEAKLNSPALSGDVGYDIVAVEEKWLFPLIPKKITTGIVIECPKDHYCTVETRGGHGVKHNLRAHRGIIDNGYRGEVGIKMYNHGWFPYKIKKGEKIAQLVFHPIAVFPLEEVHELTKTERGARGFHSTGKK